MGGAGRDWVWHSVAVWGQVELGRAVLGQTWSFEPSSRPLWIPSLLPSCRQRREERWRAVESLFPRAAPLCETTGGFLEMSAVASGGSSCDEVIFRQDDEQEPQNLFF